MRALLSAVLVLCGTAQAAASITFDANEVRSTAAAHWSDATQTLAWGTAPTGSTQIVYVCGIMRGVDVTFNTPTATNITFSSAAAAANDATNDSRLACFYGVPTGTVGDVTLTTSATSSSVGVMRMGSFTSTTGWTAPTGPSPCQEEADASTSHDAGCSGLTTTSGTGSIIFGYTMTGANGTLTVDASGYTELTRVASSAEIVAYRITTGAETVTWTGTSVAGVDSASIQFALDEDAAGGAAARQTGLLLGVW